MNKQTKRQFKHYLFMSSGLLFSQTSAYLQRINRLLPHTDVNSQPDNIKEQIKWRKRERSKNKTRVWDFEKFGRTLILKINVCSNQKTKYRDGSPAIFVSKILNLIIRLALASKQNLILVPFLMGREYCMHTIVRFQSSQLLQQRFQDNPLQDHKSPDPIVQNNIKTNPNQKVLQPRQ